MGPECMDLWLLCGIVAAQGFMDLSSAAQWAGVSVRTLERWIGRGLRVWQEGPGTKRLIRAADIEAYLTSRQAPKPALAVMVREVFDGLQGGKRG